MIAWFLLGMSLALVLYTWVGYPVLLRMLLACTGPARRDGGLPAGDGGELPAVSVIIPVYNASRSIDRKLANTLGLDYPAEKIEVLIVSDGSTDDTRSRVMAFRDPRVRWIELERNQGKSSAQNRGVQQARGDLLLFTDVESVLEKDFVQRLVPAFRDPQVAGAGGTAVLRADKGAVSRSQGIYWKLERFLRQAESDLGMLHSLPGWGFAIRANDFVPLQPDTGDDMILPLDIALLGKRCVVVPDAIVSDVMPSTIRGEFRARQRITLRNLTGLLRRRILLNPRFSVRMALALWSHKMLRWLTPVFLILLFFSTLWLYGNAKQGTVAVLFYAQVLFYSAGLAGIVLIANGIRLPLIGFPASFLLFNAGFLAGLFKYLKGKQVHSYTTHDGSL